MLNGVNANENKKLINLKIKSYLKEEFIFEKIDNWSEVLPLNEII